MRGSGRRPAKAGLALAGLMLTVTGCTQVLPLGLAAVPVPSQLAAAIVMQPAQMMPATATEVVQGVPSTVACPAGYAMLPAGGQPPGSAGCYRRLGAPATFTTAAVTIFHEPRGPHGQPAQYVLRITLPTAEAAVLTAITAKVAGTQDRIAIIIANQTWAIPMALKPLTSGAFDIPAPSLNQALRLQRILTQPG